MKFKNIKNVLNYASSKVDFNIAEGGYMLPSNMVLAMGNKTGFNNKILVSDQGFKIGINRLINKTAPTASKVVYKTVHTVPRIIEKQLMKSVFYRENIMMK